MSALRKNVASQVVTFALVNATTGAALTGATVTVKVTLDGTQSAGAGTVTELGSGQYKYVPTQGETNGTSVGLLFTATNAVPVNLHAFTTNQDPTATTVNANVTSFAAGQDEATRRGTAQAGAAGSITLDASASAVDSFYNWQIVAILSGTGAGQARAITGYTGSTKVATVAPNWATNPDNTSVFVIVPAGRVDVGAVAETTQTARDLGANITGDIYARLGAPVGASISADIAGVPAAALDLANGIETSITLRQAMRLLLAASAGKLSGAATTTIVIRNVGDTKDRITATVDANGNRTAVTTDAT